MLAGPLPDVAAEPLRDTLSRLRCLQLDPVAVVAPSHQIVLWSRIADYRPADLDHLLWEQRWLFEYWAHAASIVLTDDYPIFAATIRGFPTSTSSYGRKIGAWLQANTALREHVLHRLAAEGPLSSGAFEDVAAVGWTSGGWTSGRNVERMLDYLWMQGHVMVSARKGRTRLWDLTERCLSHESRLRTLPDEEVVAAAAQHALLALGMARAADIRRHFTRERYPGLEFVLANLVADGRAVPMRVAGGTDDGEEWYVVGELLPALDRIESDGWLPRTTLLSPFDNVICDRERTERLWGFTFRNEMYLPQAKRQYGYYTLPLLHGDQLTGRVSARLDRRQRVLRVEGLYAEDDAPSDGTLRDGLVATLHRLATFLGAERTVRTGPAPKAWESAIPEDVSSLR